MFEVDGGMGMTDMTPFKDRDHGCTPVRLSTLLAGQMGEIEDAGQCADCDLLNALGMTERCQFRVCKAGMPCIVQVGGTRIGLAPDVAEQILVRPAD